MSYEALADEALEKLHVKQDIFKLTYNYGYWFYNQSTGLFRLYNSDEDEVFFRYIPVGSYSSKTQTWMWGWDNEHSIVQTRYATLLIKEFGQENNYEKLAKGYFPADEYTGWELTAISLHFLDGLGAYRLPISA